MSIDDYTNGMNEGSQRRGSVKDRVCKRPVSILVIIYAQNTKRVPTLQWRDDLNLWQSVIGNMEEGETTPQAAMYEVKEKVAIGVVAEQPTPIDCQHTVRFEIFSHLCHRYTPNAVRNTESWFCLALPHERQIVFTEHLAYKWLDAPTTVALTKSWSNRQAIEQLVVNVA